MRSFLILTLVITSLNCSAQLKKEENIQVVHQFKKWIANDNLDSLVAHISFPMNRYYPLPDLKNEQDFRIAYPIIFDAELKNTIATSVTKDDWSEMGWRGIMLHAGIIWLDHNGNLIGINYHAPSEKKKRDHLIAEEKLDIHSSLRDFKQPILVMRTERFIIRIDALENGMYRYASWGAGKNQSEKPDLTLNNGAKEFNGSGGNHTYVFKSGVYIYEIAIQQLGAEDSPPGRLAVIKNEEEILAENALFILD